MKKFLALILITVLPSCAMLPAQTVSTGNHRQIFTATFVPSARVQSNSLYSTGNANPTLSYTSAGAGDLMVEVGLGNASETSVTDTQGNTWNGPFFWAGNNGMWFAYACGIAGGSGSVTVHWNAGVVGHMAIAEYSNIKTSSCLDTNSTPVVVTSGPTSNCTSTSFLANDAVIVAAAEEPSTSASYSSTTSGFSLYVQNGGGAAFSVALLDKLNVSAGSYAPNVTNVSSNYLYCIAYGFKHA